MPQPREKQAASNKASRKKKSFRRGDGDDGGDEDSNTHEKKQEALEAMVATYKEREERIAADAKLLREEARDAKHKNRALFDR